MPAGVLQERLAGTRQLIVNAMAFHPSGEYLALGCDDGSLVVYDWPSMTPKLELT